MAEEKTREVGGPGNRGKRPMEKPKNAKKTLIRVFSYFRPYKTTLVIILLGILLSSATGVMGNYFLKPLINDYVVPFIGQSEIDWSGFIQMILLMAGVYLAGTLGNFLYTRLMINVSTGVMYSIRRDMFEKMQRLPLRYFDSRTHGEIMSRYTNDIDTLREMIANSIPQTINSTISIVGVFTMMVILSWQLTAIVILMLFLQLFIVSRLGGKSASNFIRQQRALGSVNGYIEEMIEGQKVVKVFCHEQQVKNEFNELNEELCSAARNANIFANILMPIMGNLGHIQYAIVAATGGVLAIHSLLDLGSIGAFLQYTRSFSMPITQMSQQINAILNALAGAERIFSLIDEAEEVDEGYVTLVNVTRESDGSLKESSKRTGLWAWKHPHHDGSLTYQQLMGHMEMDHVTFGYVPEKTVLRDISVYAEPGQKIAFVGSTGAGKTTIINLLNRFYDVPDGKIRYDGININKIKKDDLRASIAMVLQDTHLFTGTVMDNIRYGKLDATDEECIRAARIANAHFFISHLPQGYDTMLTADGANLSQGQRQLIAIARAAVADPPVLVLDEATSSIDTRTESLIERGMNKLMEGRTVFVIAHRLSTVRNADAIMVLENGEIIERGNHSQLLAEKGRYYQLYTGMFELT